MEKKNQELDADPIAIQQVEFVGAIKKVDSVNGDDRQSVLMILEKIKETKLKFSQGSITDGEL